MLAWHLSRLAFFSHHATFPSKACRFVLLVAFDRNIGSACCWRTGAAVLDISALQAISVDRELVIQRFVCYADVLRSFVAVLCKTHQWFFFVGVQVEETPCNVWKRHRQPCAMMHARMSCCCKII